MDPRLLNNKGQISQKGQGQVGIFSGSVADTGTLTNAPAGWTCSAPSSSVFTITHGLDLTANSYKVMATVTGATAGNARVSSKGADTFTITTSDLATPSAADRAFDFVVIVGDDEA